MRFFRTGYVTAVGVDIGEGAVKLAQARVEGPEVRVLRTAVVERRGTGGVDGELAELIAQVIRRRGFEGRAVVVGAPMGALKVESLEVPAGGAASAVVKQIAGVELGRVGKMRVGTYEHAVWELPALARGGNAAQVMGVALAHGAADAVVEPLVGAGLDVVSVCPLPNALNSWAARQSVGGEETVHTVVDIGWSGTRFVIGSCGEQMLYYRKLDEAGLGKLREGIVAAGGGEEAVAEHVLRSVGMKLEAGAARRVLEDAVEAIAHELKLTQAYVGHRYQQYALGDVWVTGGGGSVPGMAEAIGEMMGQEARVLGVEGGWSGSVAAVAAAVYSGEARR